MTASNFYVYALFRENGSPFYIGKGRRNRAHEHTSAALRGSQNPFKDRTILKVLSRRSDLPVCILRSDLTEREAFETECALIAAIGRGPGLLTNITDGGEGVSGYRHTAATRAVIAALHTGRKLTPEHCEKIGQVWRGKKRGPFSAEHREKLSRSHKGKLITGEALVNLRRATAEAAKRRIGVKLSEDHREKLRVSHLGQAPSNKGKRTFLERTHCKHGHALTESNIMRRPSGVLECFECHREQCRRTRAKKIP